jgi:MerR family transcriptional regulator, heat shock protein HspR
MPASARPLYTIATAAELLGVSPRTLRAYEAAGLLTTGRRHTRRLYSDDDLHWIRCIRYLLHEKALNARGLCRLLARVRCWERRGCTEDSQAACPARHDRTAPCWLTVGPSRRDRDAVCARCQVYALARNAACTAEEAAAADASGSPL